MLFRAFQRMSVDPSLLVVALLLLWFPRQWMRVGRVFAARQRRHTSAKEAWKREPGDPRLTFEEFGKIRNHFDLLRGLAGGLALVGSHWIDPAIAAGTQGAAGAGKLVLAAQVGLLLVGLLIQVVRRERGRVSFYAPIFYLAGISVGLCGHWPALFGFVLVWALNPMFGNAEAFLTVYAGVLFAFSFVFGDTSRLLAISAAVLIFLPVLLSLLFRKPLVVFTRKPMHAAAS
jgi:hypothetical protein